MLRLVFAASVAAGLWSVVALAGTTFPSPPLYPSFTSPRVKITKFDPSGSTNTESAAINANGVIVGVFTDSNDLQHGFIRAADGKITKIHVGSQGTRATGINDKGVVVGTFQTDTGENVFIR